MKKIGSFFVPDNELHYQKHDGPIEDYQVDQRRYAFKFVKDWSLAVDLGANVGIFSLHFSRLFRRVIAVEPIPANVECLKMNVPPGNVDIKQVAVGEEPGTITMYPGYKSGSHAFVFGHEEVEMPEIPERERDRLVQVPMITLDSLDLPSCGLIKVDLQGSELIALRGARATIARCRPVVMLEEKRLGPDGSTRHIEECMALMKELGMTMKDRVGADRIYVFESPVRALA